MKIYFFLPCSGFEDDFNSVSDFKLTSRAASRSTTFSNDPFDDFAAFPASSSSASSMSIGPVKNTVNIRNMKPIIQPKPVSVSIGSTNFFVANSSSITAPSPLSFGDVTAKTAVVSMPTIIKPASLATSSSSSTGSRKLSPIHVPLPSVLNELKKPSVGPSSNYKELDATSDESFEDEPSSPPMPTIPAPVLVLDNKCTIDDSEETESYGIALFDFDSDVTEDLSFRVSKIQLF